MKSKATLRSVALIPLAGLATFLYAFEPLKLPSVSLEAKTVLDRISSRSLKGHVYFLASDLLEGRDTPSAGLNIAAEYIATNFERMGLTPAGDDGFFQKARVLVREQANSGIEMTLHRGGEDFRIPPGEIRVQLPGNLDLRRAPMTYVDELDVSAAQALTAETISGRVVVMPIPNTKGLEQKKREELHEQSHKLLDMLRKLKPAVVLYVYDTENPVRRDSVRVVSDPDANPDSNDWTVVRVYDERFYKQLKSAKSAADTLLSVHLPAMTESTSTVRNVAGVITGSDPILKNTYVLVTAHYDHVGVRPDGEGDRIFNGANDDASGVASVLELAAAIAQSGYRPKRSIVFMTYFGEEKGLFGSRYYARHPLFPLKSTVADLNLEQLGRTDADGSLQVGSATLTGFGYSDLTEVIQAAGAATGIRIYDSGKNGDTYYSRSDNQALADRGVPSHTILTSFMFPDYHKESDHADKLDYNNLEKVDRMIALTLLLIADNPLPPKWKQAEPKAGKYLKAWEQEHSNAVAH